MLSRSPKPWALPERLVSDERAVMSRRDVMRRAALAAGGIGGGAILGCRTSSSEPPIPAATFKAPAGTYPVKRSPAYQQIERPITPEKLATRYNNYYEFSTIKEEVHELVSGFATDPWKLEVGGLCQKPRTFDLLELIKRSPLEERIYRFRCVEAWSMTVPWTGFPLKFLLDQVVPLGSAKFVRFLSHPHRDSPGVRAQPSYPWPYFEGLRLDEAMHELTLLVTGMYGKDLPKQDGAPIRLIVPWKYGYKSAKSLVKIELVETRPATFWNQLVPAEYSFLSNVDPTSPHPRWSQRSERLIDSEERILTQAYNGYAAQVASLYAPPAPAGG